MSQLFISPVVRDITPVAGIIGVSNVLLLTDPGATMVALVTFLGFYCLAGILVLRHPLLAALTVPTVIVIILGVEGLIMGVLEIIAGFSGGGIGSFIMGVLYVLVGLLLLASPLTAALAVPLVFGILLLIQGVAHVVLAFRVRA